MVDGPSFDVVVIGGGMAGSIAAVRAAELGLSVAVLEKGASDRYLCNARFSGGIFHVAYHDVKVPESELLAAIEMSSGGYADPELARVMAQDARRLVDWLSGRGARFIRTGRVAWQNWMLAPPRALVAGLDWKGRGPDVLLRQLAERLASAGGRLFLDTRATTLAISGQSCVGVEAVSGGNPVHFAGRAVIIADGGFQANEEMLCRYIAPRPECLKQRGAATGLGDGIRMAEAAGAALTAMNRFYGHLLSRDAMHNDKVWPYPELDAVASAGIVVDGSGRRFVDEGCGGIYLANAIAGLPDPLCATIICDARIWDTAGRSARIPANPALVNAGGTVHRADSLAALAAKAGLPATALEATVASYNGAHGEGRLGALSPPRMTSAFAADRIETPPYCAIPVCAGITYTMGGIRVDGHARVLRGDGTAIAGLYAAGSTTGGLEGGDRAAYLGGLSKAGVLGLRAAEHIAGAAASFIER